MISPNKIMGALVYRTREALNKDEKFLGNLVNYAYYRNCYDGERFTLWHYPGTGDEISAYLLELDKVGYHRYKFPAVFNFQPIRQEMQRNPVIHYNLAIAGSVKSEWLTEQREAELFDNLLRPIYVELMNQIMTCPWIMTGYDLPPHDYYDVFTVGNGNLMRDKYGEYVDAIELHDLTLAVKKLCQSDEEEIIKENELLIKL